MEFDKAKFMEKLKELVAYGKKKKSVLEYQETPFDINQIR